MNHLFCEYCKQNSIIHVNPFSHGKAEFIERLNATIQKLLYSHMLEIGNQNFLSVLTLFHMRGGHYDPEDHKRPRCFNRVRAATTKIYDFVSVYA